MSEALRSFFLVMIFGLITMMQWNLDADKTATRQLKNSLEIAVHDASLAIDESELIQGLLVFDEPQGTSNFKESLKYHLQLDDNLKPLPDSFYKNPFVIKKLVYIDEKTIDPNTGNPVRFPYVYENTIYDVVDVLDGPSVIAIVETTSPRYFRGDAITIRQASVYEYIP